MRCISFSLTTPQFTAGIKTVTRRIGWARAKAGVNVFPALKGGDFLYRWATFRPDKENVSSRVHVAIMRASAV